MSVPCNLSATGRVSAQPANSSSAFPTLSGGASIAIASITYGRQRSGTETLAAAVDEELCLDGFTAINFALLRVTGGNVTVKLTSPAGADQAVIVSDLFVFHSPAAGGAITAIKLTGTAQVEWLVAGT